MQGIGFRWATKHQAHKLNLVGWVQNQPDGSVYLEAQGQEADLGKLLAWCRKEPLWAKVERVEFEESELKGYNTFDIKTS